MPRKLLKPFKTFQHVTQPNRSKQGQTSNCLDLIFTDEEAMLENLEITDPLGVRDHFTLLPFLSIFTL